MKRRRAAARYFHTFTETITERRARGGNWASDPTVPYSTVINSWCEQRSCLLLKVDVVTDFSPPRPSKQGQADEERTRTNMYHILYRPLRPKTFDYQRGAGSALVRGAAIPLAKDAKAPTLPMSLSDGKQSREVQAMAGIFCALEGSKLHETDTAPALTPVFAPDTDWAPYRHLYGNMGALCGKA